MTECAESADAQRLTSIAQALSLTPLSTNAYLADPVPTGRRALYGGQLIAQAARAAANTVADDRILHSLHAYFLRPGQPHQPIVYRVQRDSDGGRYSTRRVTATQGKDILTLSCSFVRPKPGPEFQASTIPTVSPPANSSVYPLDPYRMFDVEALQPEDSRPWYRWPARLWVRVREPLGEDANDRACAMAFLSDVCTGLSRAPHVQDVGLLPSIDHAVWLHRPALPNDWMLLDLDPVTTGDGRGVYTGRILTADGTLLATLAQESLFDPARGKRSSAGESAPSS